MWLFGFICLIWPTTHEQRKLTEERQNQVCALTDWLSNRGGFSLSAVNCVVLRRRRSADERGGKKSKKGTRRIIRAWRIVLNCPTHSCMHTYAWAPAPAHTFCRRKTRIHTRPRLKDFGPICTCMQANQGLFTDRKQRVTQGEMFVMEIWTAGVGKQS